VQDLQGKAERVKPGELLNRLVDAFAEKTALRRRHEAVARVAGHYDVNNTYQCVIAREDQHLAWLAAAIRDAGGAVSEDASGPLDLPAVKRHEALHPVILEDARALDAFVEAWRPRAAGITHARHKRMVEVMLGEMQEHARLFHQAASGREDLIGRRTGGARTAGSVLPTRWVE
jgi:hypothetical protein